MSFLNQKIALVSGIISKRSIAYGIAEAMYAHGATLILTYQNERFEERIKDIASDFGHCRILPCDVADESAIANLFSTLQQDISKLDILVHSIAYAPADQISGDYLDNVTRDGFLSAHEISSYSLSAMAKYAKPLMANASSSSVITLSYHGAQQVLPGYNTMGIAKASLEASVRYLAHSLGAQKTRVNAISAGPIRTMAAAGIKDFKQMLKSSAESAPLPGNVTIEEVGQTAAWLGSDLSQGITGTVVYVDNGLHIMGKV